MLRFVPPAGTPLGVAEILHAWRASVSANGERDDRLPLLGSRLGVRHILGASSGRAALWLVLKALHRLRPDKNVVALPAYTCFSVAASVVRAGLRLHVLDIDPATLDFDASGLDALPKDDLLCIVTSHLFGFLNDVSRTEAIAKRAGAYLVDNAAQALGATRDEYQAGTGGDVGIYSFGRGKALPAMEGGAIVTNNDELAGALREEAGNLPGSSSFHGARLLAELLAYSAFLRPRLYWIAEGMPLLKLGTTVFDTGFPVQGLHPLSRELVVRLFDRLNEVNEVRRKNAACITGALDGCASLRFPQPALHCQPTMVRLPVIARDERMRARAVNRLRQAGIGASTFYPSAICDIPGIERHITGANFHCEKAERLSRTLFTLPVHPFVKQRDIERMIGILRRLESEGATENAGSRATFSAKRA